MSITHAYWIPPAEQDFKVQKANFKPGDLGFRNDIPWPLPVTIGAEYFGEGREELPLPKVLNSAIQGEYHARGNIVPSSGGIPLVNIYSKIYKFKRGKTERRFKE